MGNPPPQDTIPASATVLGTIGTVLWCIQLIPQIWQNWRRKSTDGVPAWMMILWATSCAPLGVYAIVQNFNIPVQLQPQIFAALTLITLAQVLMYTHRWTMLKAWGAVVAYGAVLAGIEVMLIMLFKMELRKGNFTPTMVSGIVAAVLQVVGLVPLYVDMAKRKGRVVGINFVFLAIDMSGAILSLASLIVQHYLDPLGVSNYVVVIAGEMAIYVSHFIWWLLHRKELDVRKDLESGASSPESVVADPNGDSKDLETTPAEAGASAPVKNDNSVDVAVHEQHNCQ